ncbi:predicted protein [Naegleria gruberi]|uniref:Predicted protein n=1 Tax=Naegleria gruberi TaxID=5762 RepID=D2VDI3_NAEGR|nr:uncharacterized protein NAEGRDRAFT_66853 [Naegleria gruberi]EFC45240.1 predicted protein [Naegleria gruberi]|eukprot:XP_002677984.1 predicted protein [Naegleria gruberi strain NEG-M]
MVIGKECVCPLCPQAVSPDQEQASRTTHEPKSLNEIIEIQQQQDQHHSRNLIFESEEMKQIDNDCSKECLYGGRRMQDSIDSVGKCECYCGKNEMTPENQPIYPCHEICHNKFIVEIERNQHGCQSGCVCSKNIAFGNDFIKLKLDIRSMEDNCKFLEKSIRKMSEHECDEQCGKDIGGQLVPYLVVLGERSLTCSNTKYCKCNNRSDTHNGMRVNSNQSQCQRECNHIVSHVEYSFSNDLKCHCK